MDSATLRDAAEKAWTVMVAIERDVWWGGDTCPSRIALREAIEALDAALDAEWEQQGVEHEAEHQNALR